MRNNFPGTIKRFENGLLLNAEDFGSMAVLGMQYYVSESGRTIKYSVELGIPDLNYEGRYLEIIPHGENIIFFDKYDEEGYDNWLKESAEIKKRFGVQL